MRAAVNELPGSVDARQDQPVVVERLFHARRERVFRAWTDPALMGKWFSPTSMRPVGVEAQAVTGGSYRIGIREQDGEIHYVAGKYLEVQPPERLVFTWGWLAQPPEFSSLVTVEFFEQGEATRVVLTHERLRSPQDRADHLRGWGGCLEQLELSLLSGEL
jgi:uncharacterized protein YndB with AHSA1/START domain